MRFRFTLAAFAASLMLMGCQARSETAYEPQDVTVPERLIVDLQQDFGLTEHQAAGIAGNLAHESGNFTMLKQIGGSCFGYSQWCGSRKKAFDRFASRNGGPTSYAANYGFLARELSSSEYEAMLERIRREAEVDGSALIFMKEFLRPAARTANLSRRIQFAETYLAGDFEGAACYSRVSSTGRNSPAPCR